MRRWVKAIMGLGVLAAATVGGVGIAYEMGWIWPPEPPKKVTSGDLKDIPVLMPDDDPVGLVVLVSGKGGPGRTERQLTDRLLAENMIVLPVNLETWRKVLDADDGECLYFGSDLEDIAKETLRTVDLDAYFHPLVVGVGEGGALAYAALADAPVATLAGAVALDPTPTLDTRLPTCLGAVPIVKSGNGFAYGRDNLVPGGATLISAEPLPPMPAAAGDAPEPIPPADGDMPKTVVEADAGKRMDLTVQAAVDIAADDARTQALPIVDIPAQGKAQSVAIFFSGDGGWRDIDKSLGDEMARNGIHVVGVDSLRYFWSERTPDEIAQDTAAILSEADPGGKLPLSVFGYSFGADTFPFAWSKLPDPLKARTRMVALLGTEKTTKFQVSVGGWLGIGGDQDVAQAITTIPPQKVLCVHGTEEDETACTDPRLKGVEVLTIEGGHHFDEEYDALAGKLIEALQKRIGAAT